MRIAQAEAAPLEAPGSAFELQSLRLRIETAMHAQALVAELEAIRDAALFETTLTVDPRKEVVAFVIETPRIDRSNEATRLGIFAVTGVWAEGAR